MKHFNSKYHLLCSYTPKMVNPIRDTKKQIEKTTNKPNFSYPNTPPKSTKHQNEGEGKEKKSKPLRLRV